MAPLVGPVLDGGVRAQRVVHPPAGTLLAPLFRWVPEIPVDGAVIVNNVRVQQTMYLGLSPVFGALAAVALLFWLGAVLLERDVEL